MKAYVINVKEDTDKKARFLASYPSDVLPEPTVWNAKTGEDVVKPAWWKSTERRWALVENFIDIFKDNLDSKEDVLIFEDDCIFHSDFSYLYTEFMKQVPTDYDVIFLGYQPYMMSVQVDVMTLKLAPSLCSHACIYTPKAIKILYDLYTEPNWGCRHYNDQRKAQAIGSGAIIAYGPLDNLCGQAAGYSRLSAIDRVERWYSKFKYKTADGTVCTNLLCRRLPEYKSGLRDCFASITGTNLVGAEIGVYKGEATNIILEKANVSKLYCIDNFSCANGRNIKELFKIYTHKHAQKITLLEGDSCSEPTLSRITEALDFVYIDAGHTYEKCKTDIESYSHLLKENGVLMGHDYDRDGVKQAVDEYAANNGLMVETYPDNSWKLIQVNI